MYHYYSNYKPPEYVCTYINIYITKGYTYIHILQHTTDTGTQVLYT